MTESAQAITSATAPTGGEGATTSTASSASATGALQMDGIAGMEPGKPEGQQDAGKAGENQEGSEGTEKAEGEKAQEAKWFMEGKYKTVDDFAKSQEKRYGSVAKQLDDIKKALESKPQQQSQTVAQADINPDTGRAYTETEIRNMWTDLYQNDPVRAMELREKANESKTQNMAESIKADIIKQLTWSAFVSANPEVADPEKTQELNEVLEAFPLLQKQKDGLIKAKEIMLSDGDDLETKYANWIGSKSKSKTEGTKGKTVSTQMPGQQTITKQTGSGKQDDFDKWVKCFNA